MSTDPLQSTIDDSFNATSSNLPLTKGRDRLVPVTNAHKVQRAQSQHLRKRRKRHWEEGGKTEGIKEAQQHIEQKYRQNLSNKFAELFASIPQSSRASDSNDGDSIDNTSKPSKGAILKNAIDYIQQLEAENRAMASGNQELVHQLEELESLLEDQAIEAVASSSASESPIQRPRARTFRPNVHWTRRSYKYAMTPKVLAMPDNLVKTAREQLYVGLFCCQSLPYGRPYSHKAAEYSSNGWPWFVSSLSKSDDVLRRTAVAMTTAIIGAENHDRQLYLKGLELYNDSLHRLSKVLKQPYKSQANVVLATIRMMQLFELFFGLFSSWTRHLEGIVAVILAKGPEAFTSELDHQIFADSRILAAMVYCQKREPSPLSTPEWRTVPWRDRPKSARDLLLDILTDLPEVLWRLDAVQNTKSNNLRGNLSHQLEARCYELLADLNNWKRLFNGDLHRFDYHVTGNPIPPPENDVEFALLHLTSIYWITCLVIYSSLSSISIPMGRDSSRASTAAEPSSEWYRRSRGGMIPTSTRVSNTVFLKPTPDPAMFASKITYSAHLFYEPHAGFIQGGSALFPIAVVLSYYKSLKTVSQQRHEIRLLQDLIETPFMGTHIGRFLESIENIESLIKK